MINRMNDQRLRHDGGTTFLKNGFFLSFAAFKFNFDLVRLSPSPSLPMLSSLKPGIFWSIMSRPRRDAVLGLSPRPTSIRSYFGSTLSFDWSCSPTVVFDFYSFDSTGCESFLISPDSEWIPTAHQLSPIGRSTNHCWISAKGAILQKGFRRRGGVFSRLWYVEILSQEMQWRL